MKSILIILALFFSIQVFAQVHVRGYYRKDCTYVKPHQRSKPDGNPYNNYSFPGNTNPHTGKVATGNPDTYLKNYHKNSTTSNGGYNNNSNRQINFSNQNVTFIQSASTTINFSPKTYWVSASSLNVRTGPSANYTIIGTLHYGAKIQVSDHYSNGWKKIIIHHYNNRTHKQDKIIGYVSGQYLKINN